MKSNPNVFVDLHHASLLNSFIMLFEKRMGGNVYRPIGKSWFDEGYWAVYDHPATVEQYLSIGGATPDGTPKLNEPIDSITDKVTDTEGLYWCQDIDSGSYNKAITLSTFYRLPIDIVIATLPQHILPYKKLAESHPNKPKFIYQIGNAWDIPDDGTVKNIMASAVVPTVKSDLHFIQYHQEFDTEIFKPMQWTVNGDISQPLQTMQINSFINCFQDFPDWPLFLEIERLLPTFQFASYGGQCRNGAKHGSVELARAMQDSMWIWHTKAGGDGYGHVLFNSAAVGRPIITKKSYYRGKLGENLMIDGVTCIDIDNMSPSEIVYKIVQYSKPEAYSQMCTAVIRNFKQQVDFDAEFKQIKVFLDNLS